MAPAAVECLPFTPEQALDCGPRAADGRSTKPIFRSGDPTAAMAEISDPEVTGPPKFDSPWAARAYFRHRLAIAFRIFAQFGCCEGVAGHVTFRDPVDPTSFWVNPFAAYAIHAELHRARPDVKCAVHAHTIYGRAMSSTGRPLRMLTQDFCVFWRDIVLYPNFGGVVFAAEEGRAIASALGGKKAVLLANHGLLVAGPSIEATVAWFVLLEKCCQIQLLAEAAVGGGEGDGTQDVVTIGDTEAEATWRVMGAGDHGYFMGLPLFQVGEREFGEATYLGRGVEER